MLPLVVFVDVIVVVLPVPRARVVGRVNVNAIDLTLIGKHQQLQRVVVVRLNQHMVRCGRVAVGHRIDGGQRRVSGFAHTANDHHLFNSEGLAGADRRLAALFKLALSLARCDRHHPPNFGQIPGLFCHPFAAFDTLAIHGHHLRLMFFKHQAKPGVFLELGDLIRDALP